eukprot:1139334-Pelagomonas_calceolata.AAC.20
MEESSTQLRQDDRGEREVAGDRSWGGGAGGNRRGGTECRGAVRASSGASAAADGPGKGCVATPGWHLSVPGTTPRLGGERLSRCRLHTQSWLVESRQAQPHRGSTMRSVQNQHTGTPIPGEKARAGGLARQDGEIMVLPH